jgi:hypothetical protein
MAGKAATAASDRYRLRSEPDAERTVIGSLLLSATNGDPDCAATIFDRLSVGDFTDTECRTIFAAMVRLHERGEPLEHGLVVAALKGELENPAGLLLEAVSGVTTTATAGHYAKLVTDASRQRRAVCAVNDALNGLRSCNGHVGNVLATLRTDLANIPSDPTPASASMRRAMAPYMPFPVTALPTAVGAFVTAASTAIGCDPSFVALPLLACLACAIGNKRTIKLKRTWTEPAIIWAAIVGKSGSHKTPAIQAAMHFLQRKQAEAIAQYAEALAGFEQQKAIYERDYSAWKRSRKSGPTEPPPWPPQEPACQRYITTDTTIEALASLLAAQFDGLLVSRDELAGWLGGIAEYKGGKGSDLGHWLASWSAAPLTVDRKTGAIRMLHVSRAAVSIVGGIQPAVLRTAIGREHLQDGLCARLLLAMPETRPVRWSEAIVDPPTEAALGSVFDRLLSLEPAADEDGHPAPFAMPLTPEAKAAWVEFYDRHRDELSDLDDDLAAAWSKLEAYAARFALIFQLCSWAAGAAGCDAVSEASIRAGIMLADWFGNEARRVYALLAESEADREDRELVELIRRKGGSVTPRDLMRACRLFVTSADAEAALDVLVKAGRGQWQNVPTGPKGGKPSRVFYCSDAVDADNTPTNSVENTGYVNVNAVNGPPTDNGNRRTCAGGLHAAPIGTSTRDVADGMVSFEAERKRIIGGGEADIPW